MPDNAPLTKPTGRLRERWNEFWGGFIDSLTRNRSIVLAVVFGVMAILGGDEIYRNLGISDGWRQVDQIGAYVCIVLLLLFQAYLDWTRESRERRLEEEKAELQARLAESERKSEECAGRLDEANGAVSFLVGHTELICEAYLADLAKRELPATSDVSFRNALRITLYVHDSDRHFLPIGRHSDWPAFSKRGRSAYLDSEGYIGKAWEKGECFEKVQYAEGEEGEWIDNACRNHLRREDARDIKMKSRVYYGTIIPNETGSGTTAVILVESMLVSRFTKKAVKAALNDHRKKCLARLVTAIRPYLANVEEARRKGL